MIKHFYSLAKNFMVSLSQLRVELHFWLKNLKLLILRYDLKIKFKIVLKN